MLSIITAIHNQLDMNNLFYENIVRYTKNIFELIVIDNASTDGSREFFESNGVKVIRNEGNYSYPYCQNQGIEAAKYDYMIFLNNDVIVSKDWDERAISIMQFHKLDIASCSATEMLETPEITHAHLKKWKRIKNPFVFFFGNKKWVLKLTHKLMYGDWDEWTEERYKKCGNVIRLGIAGSNVFVTRQGIAKIGKWDERIQSADFDIFLRAKKRSLESGDIKSCHVMLGVYLHHYNRLTLLKRKIPFADKENKISIKDKWDIKTANEMLKDTNMVVK
ncbi:MAG: glycosyltransferase [Bacteroidales bacterium]|nr:glycosyltransferase [Bacteroidales bacterium]